MRLTTALTALALAPTALLADAHSTPVPVEYGARPAYLVDKLPDGDLKDKLASCMGQTASKSDFSIGHRGAPLKPGGPVRRVLNLVYARSDVRHITAWNCRLCLPEDGSEPRERAVARAAEFGFCRSMYFGAEDELNRASVARKSRLGVPPPGHPYWTRELHTAVASRFPNGAWGEYATGELRVERQAEQAERVQA